MPRLHAARLAAAAALLLLPAATSCAARSGDGATTAADAAAIESSAAVADRYSLYDLASVWRDQQGRRRTLQSLRGRPQVVALIYTSCSTSCPLTVAEMKRVERATSAGGANVGFVLVTLDPGHDGVARLAAFATDRALSPDRWTLLTGRDDDVRELAAALGARYRRLSPTELAHSNALTVLDASGAVAYQSAGLGGADEAIAALRALHAPAR